MIFTDCESVRLTLSELNELRRANAKNGHAVNRIATREDLLEAILSGLSPEFQDDLAEFLETGSSPLTRAAAEQAGGANTALDPSSIS